MVESLPHLAAALWFLPLFPMSGIFVFLTTRLLRAAWLRGVVFVVWPIAGELLLGHATPPTWIRAWALITALLYAVRLLATRDLRRWTTYLGVSAFSLLWLLDPTTGHGWLAALAMGVPLGLITIPCAALEQRFGAAYAGLYGGLPLRQPRLSAILTLLVLASIATPGFPAFFVLTGIAFHAHAVFAAGMLLVWIIWGWASVVLLQGFMSGKAPAERVPDLGDITWFAMVVAIAATALAGLTLAAALLQGV